MYSLKYGIFGYRMTEVYEKVKWRVSQISVMAIKYNDKTGIVVLGVWFCCLGSFLFGKFWLLCLWQIMACVPRISFCTCFLCSLRVFFKSISASFCERRRQIHDEPLCGPGRQCFCGHFASRAASTVSCCCCFPGLWWALWNGSAVKRVD